MKYDSHPLSNLRENVGQLLFINPSISLMNISRQENCGFRMVRTHWLGRVLGFVFLPLAISMSPASAQTTNEVTNGGTISSGTTAIITNPVTSITGAITNDGSLEFWQSTTLNNSLVISGVGSVSQKGSGTTILSAANTYSVLS